MEVWSLRLAAVDCLVLPGVRLLLALELPAKFPSHVSMMCILRKHAGGRMSNEDWPAYQDDLRGRELDELVDAELRKVLVPGRALMTGGHTCLQSRPLLERKQRERLYLPLSCR